MAPVTNAIEPSMVFADEIFASRSVNRFMPPVFSSSAISTETPLTIMMMPQGTRRTAALSSVTRRMSRSAAAANADSPRFRLNTSTPMIHAAVTIIVRRGGIETATAVGGGVTGGVTALEVRGRLQLHPRQLR